MKLKKIEVRYVDPKINKYRNYSVDIFVEDTGSKTANARLAAHKFREKDPKNKLKIVYVK
jgi:hypothetical protein